MHCPECHAELTQQREFCPACGAPTRARLRRARSSARAALERGPRRRGVLIAGAAALLGFAVLSNVTIVSADLGSGERRGPAVIEARQLADEFAADYDAADERYRNREMVVSGEFVRIVPDGNGKPDLRLATSDPARPWGADLIPIAHEPAARLRPGQRVTVSCQRLAGSREDRWLQNCALQVEADEEAAGAEPSEGDAATP